jgi:hypothetical protein
VSSPATAGSPGTPSGPAKITVSGTPTTAATTTATAAAATAPTPATTAAATPTVTATTPPPTETPVRETSPQPARLALRRWPAVLVLAGALLAVPAAAYGQVVPHHTAPVQDLVPDSATPAPNLAAGAGPVQSTPVTVPAQGPGSIPVPALAPDGQGPDFVQSADPTPVQGRLTVTYDDGSGRPRTYRLFCGGMAGRAHPEDDAACARLAETGGPVAATPRGQACSMIYGGPQTAEVRGTWQGRPVHESYRRTDGCEVARWQKMVPALPDPVRRPPHHPVAA